MTDPTLNPFFDPRGVAILGVSHDPAKLGYALARNLVQSGYGGAVYFVNPKGGRLLGQPVYTEVAQIPDPLDLAVILTPAPAAADMLRQCGQRGVRAAIVASSGFRETGAAGAALEQECLDVIHQYGMRMIGPNCIGLIDTHLPLDTTFLQPPGPPPGEVAFISHSGAICAAISYWIHGQGFGFSRLVSLGNQADVNETDVLAPLAADPYTRVITLYLEGVSNGRRFVEAAAAITPQKPIVALKVGRFESGRRAAASHTGALAGQESAFDAAFERAGVLRASTTEEMFQWARALAWCPLPKGRNVAILTNAGGPGVTAADSLELLGLRLASLSEASRAALQKLLPPAASLQNPVDMLASATPEHYAEGLRLLLADPGVDSVMIILPPPPPSTAGAVAKALIPVIQSGDKPVVIVLMGERLIQEAVDLFRAARVVDYRFPEPAASALAVLVRRTERLARGAEPPASLSGIDRQAAQALAAAQPAGAFLQPADASRLMEAYGIPTPKIELAENAQQAAELAQRLGFPVVLKIASPDIAHKSDVGGVLLNLQSPQEVTRGFQTLLEKVHRAKPQAHLLGVQVQCMLPPGQEVIVGALRDPQFGPLVMFGSGGVEVEGLKDVAFALAPLSEAEAERMLERTWAGRKLRGYRNLPPADREAVLQVLLRLAQLAQDCPQLAEIEVNPLWVLPPGRGARAIDVRVRTTEQDAA